jgi:hypothetical protein
VALATTATERSVGAEPDASATVSDGVAEAAPAAPPTLEPYTATLHAVLLVHATTTRTLEMGEAVDGEYEDTKTVSEATSGAGHVSPALQRRICVPAVVRRTS